MLFSTGFASSPFHDTPPCGDHWMTLDVGSSHRLMLADGIGHGLHAYQIVTALGDHLKALCNIRIPSPDVETCLESLNHLLHHELVGGQAAVALVDINTQKRFLKVAIVGNVQVHYFMPELRIQFPSMDGMVGGRFPRQLNSTCAPIQSASLLALFSDGLDAMDACQYLSDLHARQTSHGRHMQAEAEAMLDRCGKDSDDASCALVWFEESTP